MNHLSLSRFAWISIAAALLTMGLKYVAYLLTDSVGLLSDALESGVNLVGALMALAMLTIAARPADEDHAYGHSKAEYFSSGVEGTLILIAAVSISVAAIGRLIEPETTRTDRVGVSCLSGCSPRQFSGRPHLASSREALPLHYLESQCLSFDDGCMDLGRGSGRGCCRWLDGLGEHRPYRGTYCRWQYQLVGSPHRSGLSERVNGYGPSGT